MILIIITISAIMYNYYYQKKSPKEELIEMKPIEITF